MARATVDKTGTSMRRWNDWVRGELKRQKKTGEDLAHYIGCSGAGLSRRLDGQTEWHFPEVLNALEFLEGKLEDIL